MSSTQQSFTTGRRREEVDDERNKLRHQFRVGLEQRKEEMEKLFGKGVSANIVKNG